MALLNLIKYVTLTSETLISSYLINQFSFLNDFELFWVIFNLIFITNKILLPVSIGF